MKFKVIAFDFSGVLFLPDSTKNLALSVSGIFGCSYEDAYKMFSWETLQHYNDTGESLENYIDKSLEILGLNREKDLDRLLHIYIESFLPNNIVLNAIRTLKAEGYKLAYITNGARLRFEAIRLRLGQDFYLFDTGLSSHESSYCKPQQEFYNEFYKRLIEKSFVYNKSEILLFDDSEEYCYGAQEFGFKVRIYDQTFRLEDILKLD